MKKTSQKIFLRVTACWSICKSMMGGILMRKIFSVIMGIFVCFWGSIGSILALGEDKIEVLRDGTVLHYISTEKLNEAISKYHTCEYDIQHYRAQERGRVGTQMLAGALGLLGYLGLSFATRGTSWQDSSIVLLGKIIIVSLASAGVVYPEYRYWREGRAFQDTYEETPQAMAYFNSGSDSSVSAALTNAYADLETNRDTSNRFGSGFVVVLRPAGTKDQFLPTGVWGVNELTQDGRLSTLKNHLKCD